jgi:hypothetical protein
LRAEVERMEAQAEEAAVLQEDVSCLRRQMALAAAASTNKTAAAEAVVTMVATPALAASGDHMGEGAATATAAAAVASDAPTPLTPRQRAVGITSESDSIEAHALEGVSSDEGSSPKAANGVEAGWQLVVASVSDEDADSSAVTAHLEQVRGKHAALMAQRQELLQLTAESELLMKDNEVLRMQLNVAVAMYSSSDPTSTQASANKAVSGDANAVEEASMSDILGGGVKLVGRDLMDGQKEELGLGVGAPLGAVFQRLRVLESENLRLQARNEELVSETDSLRVALEASLSRLDAFKGLAATVGMIRGKKHEPNSSLRS